MIKGIRVFAGGYIASAGKLTAKGYINVSKYNTKLLSNINASFNGLGKISGKVKKIGTLQPNAQICLYRRDDFSFLYKRYSDENGSYTLRNIAKGLECFVVAFDPNEEYNAVISDKVVAK